MNLKSLSIVFPLVVFAGVCLLVSAVKSNSGDESNHGVKPEERAGPSAIDVSGTELKFDEIFVTPAGPKGLQYTDKARSLDGNRVSVTGFMLRHSDVDPSIFLFCDTPRIYDQREEGLADSLPPYLAHVILKVKETDAPAWRREKLTVHGTLELGPREERSGRVSHVRIRCDTITDATTGAVLEVRMPVALQLNRALPPPNDLGALSSSPLPTPFFSPRRNRNQTQLHPDSL